MQKTAEQTDSSQRNPGRRIWTEAQRKALSEKTKAEKPWRFSTGPKTIEGKKTVSRNALKHGMESAQTKRFKTALRLQKKFMSRAKIIQRNEKTKPPGFVFALQATRPDH